MEALSVLLRRESSKFDPALLGFLIKLLGIYPPGTLVQLSDGSLGQVVAPGADSLKPKVLLYNPLTSKEDAHVL
jgi:HD-GYP domain-containing protein (c-di-GMP phosphodiesterase class II)